MLQSHTLTVYMESFASEPYWPERYEVIEIEKRSNAAYQRSDEKRRAAIVGFLEKEGRDPDEYDRLVKLADRPFRRVDDSDQDSEIVIPRECLSAALVNACKVSPSSVIKTALADSLRSMLRVENLLTGKKTQDRYFERYVKGQDSNQRRFQRTPIIEDFEASGRIAYDPDIINHKTVMSLIRYAFQYVGVGSCRKMAFGRGRVISIEPLRQELEEAA